MGVEVWMYGTLRHHHQPVFTTECVDRMPHTLEI
jgi:hypothetical protein